MQNINRVQYCKNHLRESGVVLIIALVMLAVMSLASVAAIRSSSSSEAATSSARTHGLAMQSAEAGLRYCERIVLAYMNSYAAAIKAGHTSTAATLTSGSGLIIDPAPTLPSGQQQLLDTDYAWSNLSNNWDATNTIAGLNILPLSVVNSTDTSNSITAVFLRPPECRAQFLDGTRLRAVITARGFGPEVSTVSNGSSKMPRGSEIWLQSLIQINQP